MHVDHPIRDVTGVVVRRDTPPVVENDQELHAVSTRAIACSRRRRSEMVVLASEVERWAQTCRASGYTYRKRMM